MSDASIHGKGTSTNSTEDWSKIEYHQIHEYGRAVYSSFFNLAQMTFVINPALGIGLYYILYDKSISDDVYSKAFYVAIIGIGLLYNLGALSAYRQSHVFLEKLLLRMRAIDQHKHIETYLSVELTAPASYREYKFGEIRTSKWIPRDKTEAFFFLLMGVWTAIFVVFVCWQLQILTKPVRVPAEQPQANQTQNK